MQRVAPLVEPVIEGSIASTTATAEAFHGRAREKSMTTLGESSGWRNSSISSWSGSTTRSTKKALTKPSQRRSTAMTIAGSLLLITVGAILYWATNLHVAQVSIDSMGLILMIAGAAGLVLGFIQQAIWSRRSRRAVSIESRSDRRTP